MGSYRLIALDMDGTLLNSQLAVSPGNRDAIHRAADAGRQIVISTGRCLAEICDTLKVLPEIRYLVCENGCCVYDCAREAAIHVDPISAPEVLEILEEAKREKTVVQVFSNNQSYFVEKDDGWLEACGVANYRQLFHACSTFDEHFFDDFAEKPFQVEKINLYFESVEARDRVKERLSGHPLSVSDSLGYMIELISDVADKGRGLRMLCEHLNIPVEETIAVGDSMNDISILQTAGFSAAMGNACHDAKAAADFITDDCDHDGVARVINEYLMA